MIVIPRTSHPQDWLKQRINRNGLGRFVTNYWIPIGTQGGLDTRFWNLAINGDPTANTQPDHPRWSQRSFRQSTQVIPQPTMAFAASARGQIVPAAQFPQPFANDHRQRLGSTQGSRNSPVTENGTEFTCCIHLISRGYDANYDQRIYSRDSGTQAADHDFMLGLVRANPNNNVRARIRIAGSTVTWVNVNRPLPFNEYAMIYVRLTDGEGRVGHYSESDESFRDFAQSGGYTPRFGTPEMIGGNAGSATNFFWGDIHQITFFDCGLNTTQLRQFYHDPYMFLAPEVVSDVGAMFGEPPAPSPGRVHYELMNQTPFHFGRYES